MSLKGQLSVAKSKEKSAIDAEAFILECLDVTSQNLASKISFSPFCVSPDSVVKIDTYSLPSCFLVFVPNPVKEKKRIDD